MTEMAKDESISRQIQKKLSKRGVYVHSSTVRGLRKQQRWTLQKSKYCQLICDMNKIKRLELVHRVLDTEETFDNIIFSDKCSFSLQHFHPTWLCEGWQATQEKTKTNASSQTPSLGWDQ